MIRLRLARLDDEVAEIKRMWTAPAHRRAAAPIGLHR
jgi:hypothetical protein